MRVGCLVSGGKDSLYAMYLARKKHEIKCLISLKPKKDSWMFHVPNVDLVEVQAKLIGLPLVSVKTEGVKEEELKDLKDAVNVAVKKYKIEGLVTGAIESNYQKERIDSLCKELRLEHIAPLWHKKIMEYMHELLLSKFKVVIVGVAADGLNEKWLGRIIDSRCLADLDRLNKEKGIHIGGEGGEYETFVLNCPLFKKELIIKEAEKIIEDENTGHLKIKKLNL